LLTYETHTEYNGNHTQKIALIGDIHYDHAQFQKKFFKNTIKEINKQNNLSVIIMGDLVEAGTKTSIGSGVYDQKTNVTRQFRSVKKSIKKIAHKTIGAHSGNHDLRLYKDDGMDIVEILCEDLEIPYLNSFCTHNFKINDKNWRILTTHGSTGSKFLQTKMKSVMDLQTLYDADIYCYAHTHALFAWDRIRYNATRKMRRHFCLTGSFMDYIGTYAQEKGMFPEEYGYPIINFNKDGSVFFQLIRED
jgi:predicted phosphodiesterase